VVELPLSGELLFHDVPSAVGNAHVLIEPKRIICSCSPARPRSPSHPYLDPDGLARKALKAVYRRHRGRLALAPVRQWHDWLPTMRTRVDNHDRADLRERYKGELQIATAGMGR
jgi:hypothetical protein